MLIPRTTATALLLLAAACSSEQPTAATSSPTTIPATTTSTTAASTTTTIAATTSTSSAPVPMLVPSQPQADPAPPDPALPEGSTGVAVVAGGGADIAADPNGTPFVRAHEGLVFPVVARQGDWLQVRHQCEGSAWIDGSQVAFTPSQFGGGPPGAGFDLADAIVVLDPGHGGPNSGAVGPLGTVEKDLNLDIARRTRDLLAAPHDVDWDSGAIAIGTSIPAAGTVWLTRTEGPAGADIEAGLVFRATLANGARAHALLSIHNNAAPDGPTDVTGAETYYRVEDPESKRLAGLVIEELRRGFAPFGADWDGALDAGAKYRVRSDGVTDLYGVLKNATVPAVLVEGAYLSNVAEERLLLTPEFRQAYADGLYRALVRFLTTDDPGSGFVEPINRTASPGSGSPQSSCTIPSQP